MNETNRNQRLKAAYEASTQRTEMKIPSIHKYKLAIDLKKSPNRRKVKQNSTRSGIKVSPDAPFVLVEKGQNISHRQLAGFFSTRHGKNSSLVIESQVNSSNLLFNRKVTAKGKTKSSSVENLQEIRLPLKGADVCKVSSELLNEFEVREVNGFEDVYFLGNPKNKVNPHQNEPNWGYDDDELNYKVIIGDHLAYRFEILQMLGKGSFGQVCKCVDHKTSQLVAIKIIKNKPKFHKQGAVEVKVLHHLNTHDSEDTQNIVKLFDSFTFRSHLCLVFELLSLNLYEYLKINHFQGVTLSLVRCFALQILSTLRFSSFHNIVHCDLKPENILLRNATRAAIKVIDFGSSCFTPEQIYTYIQSRFYRAPEIMLGIPYTPAIDIWSFGCILVELYTGYPVFPGESENDQMLRIMEVLGPPPGDLIKISSRKKHFFDVDEKPRLLPNSKGKIRYPGTRPLHEIIETHDPSFVDFVAQSLTWDPRHRPTADALFGHPWLSEGSKRNHRKANSFFTEEYSKSKFH
jgi:dual specificity tyrosine-phosphorylation-regulated kinase 2/3/4